MPFFSPKCCVCLNRYVKAPGYRYVWLGCWVYYQSYAGSDKEVRRCSSCREPVHHICSRQVFIDLGGAGYNELVCLNCIEDD
jgi:hypothetical protein